MSELRTSTDAVINAPIETVRAVLRDFDGHHRRILPPAFRNLVIERGGVGAGTVFRFDLTLGGRTQPARARVEEPSESVIEEHAIGRAMVTTFTLTADGDRTVTTIATSWRPAAGLSGVLERLFAPRLLRSLYVEELERLQTYVATSGIETVPHGDEPAEVAA